MDAYFAFQKLKMKTEYRIKEGFSYHLLSEVKLKVCYILKTN